MVSYLGEASKATRVLLRDGNRESHFYHTAGFNFWFVSFSLTVNEKEYHHISLPGQSVMEHNRNTGNILQYNEKSFSKA